MLFSGKKKGHTHPFDKHAQTVGNRVSLIHVVLHLRREEISAPHGDPCEPSGSKNRSGEKGVSFSPLRSKRRTQRLPLDKPFAFATLLYHSPDDLSNDRSAFLKKHFSRSPAVRVGFPSFGRSSDARCGNSFGGSVLAISVFRRRFRLFAFCSEKERENRMKK